MGRGSLRLTLGATNPFRSHERIGEEEADCREETQKGSGARH